MTALVLLFARTVAQTEERLGGELLVDLLETDPADLALRERVRRHGASLEPPLAVVVADVAGWSGTPRCGARCGWRRPDAGWSASTGGRWCSWSRTRTRSSVGDRLADEVRRAGGTLTAGVAAVDGDLAAGYAEARRCLGALHTLGRAGEVSDPAGFGVTRLLLGDGGPEELAEFVTATVGPVLEYDAQRGSSLLDTLEAWFATGGHLRRSGERLHVHPNTVAQRLDRIGELLGADWREPGRSLDLQLATRVHRLRDLSH